MPAIIIALVIIITSERPTIYWSDRVGRGNSIFRMPKFRTMKKETPQAATHLLRDAESFYIPMGKFLRKTSLDEIPQIWSVFIGHMSFVGPRPALYNQDDLIALREEKGINKLSPGISGWAQIYGRDELSIEDKGELDYEYLNKSSLLFDILIIIKTIFKVLKPKEVSH